MVKVVGMKEGYRFLGEYIRQVDIRNKEGKKENLLGVSVQKQFIQSIANTVGTDFTKYKIVKKGQFTYIPDTSRRGDKIAIALLEDYEEGLVSNVYTVFEVIDTEKLLPEYLMLWFSRPEFDRYARFKSHGSVREVMDWEEMCKVELPVPDIEKQRKIVKAYKTITDRIALKQKINDNLANQISAIYDDYFVQYKCSTVTSYIDSPLGKIPSNYKVLTIGELGCDISDGNYSSKYPKADEFQTVGIPFIRGVDFIGTNISKRNLLYITPEKHNELLKGHTKENDILITTRGVGIGKIAFVPSDMIDVNINSQLIRINGGNTYPRVFLSQSLISNRGKNEIQANVTGSAQPQLPVGNFKNIKIVIPPESQILDFCRICNPLLNAQLENYQEIDVLQKLLDVLLTKLSSR